MRSLYLAFVCCLLQIFLTFRGGPLVHKYWSPVLIMAVSLGLAAAYFRRLRDQPELVASGTAPIWLRWAGLAVGLCGVLLCTGAMNRIFLHFANPVEWSDVLPQLETQYRRFASGEFPYKPIPLPNGTPFPVYMPLHWLPVGISVALGIDVRWVAFLAYALVAGFAGYSFARGGSTFRWQLVAALVPAVALVAFIVWGKIDLGVSLELLIAAYYLLLGVGLANRNWALTSAGLVLCLLSRYTLVFWLPLFLWVVWKTAGWRMVLTLGGIMASAVVLLYVLPFMTVDPTIFTKSLAYHSAAVVDEWNGVFGGVSWSFERGVYFAPHMKAVFPGAVEQKILLGRVLQASSMLGLTAYGIFAFRKWGKSLNPFDFSLGMLYLFMLFFYLFSPLTYQYYLIVLMVLSGTLVGRIACSFK